MAEYKGRRVPKYYPDRDGDLLEFCKKNKGPTTYELAVDRYTHIIAEGHDLVGSGDANFEFHKELAKELKAKGKKNLRSDEAELVDFYEKQGLI